MRAPGMRDRCVLTAMPLGGRRARQCCCRCTAASEGAEAPWGISPVDGCAPYTSTIAGREDEWPVSLEYHRRPGVSRKSLVLTGLVATPGWRVRCPDAKRLNV